MIWFGYYAVVICAAYYFGRRNGLIGFGVFVAGVLLHQLYVDGPDSLLAFIGCDYGSRAKDC